jgi:hypothetical protein
VKSDRVRRAITFLLCVFVIVGVTLAVRTNAGTARLKAILPPLSSISSTSTTQFKPVVTAYGTTVPTIPAPQVWFVLPSEGPTTGDNGVAIYGAYLTGATQVTFGGTPTSFVTVSDDSNILVLAPAHAAGVVAVQVTTPGGTSSPVAGDYTYVETSPTAVATLTTLGGPTSSQVSTELFSASTESTGVLTAAVARTKGEAAGLAGGWIAFIVLAAVDVAAGLIAAGSLLVKRRTRGGPTA